MPPSPRVSFWQLTSRLSGPAWTGVASPVAKAPAAQRRAVRRIAGRSPRVSVCRLAWMELNGQRARVVAWFGIQGIPFGGGHGSAAGCRGRWSTSALPLRARIASESGGSTTGTTSTIELAAPTTARSSARVNSGGGHETPAPAPRNLPSKLRHHRRSSAVATGFGYPKPAGDCRPGRRRCRAAAPNRKSSRR